MATTYYSNLYNTLTDGKTNGTTTAGGHMTPIKQGFLFALTAAFVINDVIKLVPIPLNYRVTNFFVDVPALDSSTGVVSQYGDVTTTGKYVTASTVGRSSAGGYITLAGTGYVAGSIPADYTTASASVVCKGFANDFQMKVTTAATGTATTTGNVQGWLEYQPLGYPFGVF